MSNVIKVNFEINDSRKYGLTCYYINENGDRSGVLMEELSADLSDGIVYIGQIEGTSILNPVKLSKEQMNCFCRMWLGLHGSENLKDAQ